MTEGADDFGAFDAQAHEVPTAQGTFEVWPITVEKLPAFTRHIRPAMPHVGMLLDIGNDGPGAIVDAVVEVFSEHGERLIDAVSVAVAPSMDEFKDTRARVGRLDTAEFTLLAMRAVKVNADFFARRLLPAIMTAATEAKLASGAGKTPSRP